MALSMLQQDAPPGLGEAGELPEAGEHETGQKTLQPDEETNDVMKGKHVFHIQHLFPWLKMELAAGEGCMAFLCGAPSSGKSEAARQTARQFGKLVYIVSNDLAMDKKYEVESGMKTGLTMMHVSRLDDFPVVVEAVVGHRAALICDDTNAHFCDFAAKVVLALGTGMPTRNIAWFVLDEGLPEDKEVTLLFARQQQRFNNLWQGKKVGQHIHPSDRRVVPLDTIVHCVRQIRSTYFTAAHDLVQWSDEFIACEMLKWAWSEVVAWDSAHRGHRKVLHATPTPSKKSCNSRPGGRAAPPKPPASLAPLLASVSTSHRLEAEASMGHAPGPPREVGAGGRDGDAPLLDPIIESVVVSCVDEPWALNPGPDGRSSSAYSTKVPAWPLLPSSQGMQPWTLPRAAAVLSPTVVQLGGLERGIVRVGKPSAEQDSSFRPPCQTWTDSEAANGRSEWSACSPNSQAWTAPPMVPGAVSSPCLLSPTASPAFAPRAAPLSTSVAWRTDLRTSAVKFEALPQPVLHTHDALPRSPIGGDAPDGKPGLTLSSVLNGYLKANPHPDLDPAVPQRSAAS